VIIRPANSAAARRAPWNERMTVDTTAVLLFKRTSH